MAESGVPAYRTDCGCRAGKAALDAQAIPLVVTVTMDALTHAVGWVWCVLVNLCPGLAPVAHALDEPMSDATHMPHSHTGTAHTHPRGFAHPPGPPPAQKCSVRGRGAPRTRHARRWDARPPSEWYEDSHASVRTRRLWCDAHRASCGVARPFCRRARAGPCAALLPSRAAPPLEHSTIPSARAPPARPRCWRQVGARLPAMWVGRDAPANGVRPIGDHWGYGVA